MLGLRWLAGDNYIDIRHAYGCSIASIDRCRDLFIVLVNCEGLKFIFPEEREELIKLAYDFQGKSSKGYVKGCDGAMDGFLATINQPTLVDGGNNAGAFFWVITS